MADYKNNSDKDNQSTSQPSEKDKEFLKDARERFEKSDEAHSDNREDFKDNLDFYNGENHWEQGRREDRENNGQPALVVNRIPGFVRQVTNDYRQSRPGIKIKPADGDADVETAEILQGLVRNIEAVSHADDAYDCAFFNAVAGNVGYWRVRHDYIDDSFDQEIIIDPIVNSLSVHGDPAARNPDGSDSEWWFVEENIRKSEFKRRWPKADPDSWDEDEKENDWYKEDDYVRVADYYQYIYVEDELIQVRPKDLKESEDDEPEAVYLSEYKEEEYGRPMEILGRRPASRKVVKWSKVAGGAILEGYDGQDEDSGEWPGKYLPIIPVYGDMLDNNGKQQLFCLFSFAKDAQRMYNYYRSTETELQALQPRAPFIAAEGQLEGYEEEWQDANNKNYSYLSYKPTTLEGQPVPPPQRQSFQGAPQGVIQGAMNAEKDMMGTIGIYEAGLGQRSNETSGKAILARQKEGDTATYHFIDNMSKSIRRCGEVIVDMIPYIYDNARVIRVLGEDGSEKMVEINQPIPETDERGEEIEKIFDVGLGRYDVVCAAGSNFASRREEAREGMVTLAQANPALWGTHGDLIAEVMDWPNAEDFADRSRKMLPPELREAPEGEEGQEVPPEVMQLQQQAQQMQQQMEQMAQELQSKQADEAAKMAKVETDQFKAETDRLKVVGEGKDNDLTEQEKIQFDADMKITLKEMEIESTERLARFNAQVKLAESNQNPDVAGYDGELNPIPNETAQAVEEMQSFLVAQGQEVNNLKSALEESKQARNVERNESGRPVSVNGRAVMYDENGRIIGLGGVE